MRISIGNEIKTYLLSKVESPMPILSKKDRTQLVVPTQPKFCDIDLGKINGRPFFESNSGERNKLNYLRDA